jgi:uncharacterized protein
MLYLDASALVKRYVAEEGSELVLSAMANSRAWAMCRIGYVETVRAVALAAGAKAVKRVEGEWPSFDVVEVDSTLAEDAARLAQSGELPSLDALHLAAALVLPSEGLAVATWDARLHRAARDRGLDVIPEGLG